MPKRKKKDRFIGTFTLIHYLCDKPGKSITNHEIKHNSTGIQSKTSFAKMH